MVTETVGDIEAATYAAWPPAETAQRDGWILRYGDGFSRRLNSVTPMPGSACDEVTSRAAEAGEWLAERGAAPVVRVLSVADERIDAELAGAGYSCEAETIVLTSLLARHGPHRDHPSTPTPSWCDAQRAWMSISPHDVDGWLRVLSRITAPAAFAQTERAGRTVVVGLGAVRGEWLGLFEVATAPDLRRQGHASSLVTELAAWGRSVGARRAFLQVVADNEPAAALYRSLGFAEQYRYWYRRPPALHRE